MKTLELINRPSKMEQKVAIKSYSTLVAALAHIKEEETEIEIEETRDKIIIPSRALQLLGDILKAMSEGKPCSRPHLVKLLEEGEIDFVKVGKHRRIMFEDIIRYKQKMKEEQKKHIIEMMNQDEELGLYDS